MIRIKSKHLTNARKAKKDEFYTQLKDVENEMENYIDHFANKTILMNADNPKYSNFWKYFLNNFQTLKLKKIICTHYKENNTSYMLTYNGKQLIKTNFLGDGDFRSQEVLDVMDKSDIVITNPPFSLFNELINLLVKYDKKFILVGNQNAITQKTMWKLIQNKKVWLGVGFPGCVGFFHNDEYDNYAVAGKHIKGMIRVSGVYWYTNLTLDDKRKPIKLTELYNENDYPKYDNYDAINVDRVSKIPKNYFGKIGVPITFLNKYVPEQFEIIGLDTYLEDGPKTRFKINDETKYARIVITNKNIN